MINLSRIPYYNSKMHRKVESMFRPKNWAQNIVNQINISDTDIKLFTLVHSEGNEIAEEDQLGLLLYRGGTVCSDRGFVAYTAAVAICKEMNFKGVEKWTTKESFDIQYGKKINLGNVECNSEEWENCAYSEDTQNCDHSNDVFLSCSFTGLL